MLDKGRTRTILIAPPERIVYKEVEQGSINDVRDTTDQTRWTESRDIKGGEKIREVTLMGGNLELCLGSVWNDFLYNLRVAHKGIDPEKQSLVLNLPFNAIYNLDKLNLQEALAILKKQGISDMDAILTILGKTEADYNNKTSIISTNKLINYRVVINGEFVGDIKPLDQAEEEFLPLPRKVQIVYDDPRVTSKPAADERDIEIEWIENDPVPTMPEVEVILNISTLTGMQVKQSLPKDIETRLAERVISTKEFLSDKLKVIES